MKRQDARGTAITWWRRQGRRWLTNKRGDDVVPVNNRESNRERRRAARPSVVGNPRRKNQYSAAAWPRALIARRPNSAVTPLLTATNIHRCAPEPVSCRTESIYHFGDTQALRPTTLLRLRRSRFRRSRRPAAAAAAAAAATMTTVNAAGLAEAWDRGGVVAPLARRRGKKFDGIGFKKRSTDGIN